ncbi:multiprotein-bridging factor 1 family protein [Micromonospora sp. NPDC000316]|uniref:helix-turn-helix domain-containing protein n=1 Tax=Micromonospora sp. NPDC000316 TaxID=3364216 RepID=UPI0036AB904D
MASALDPPLSPGPTVGRYPIAGLVRRARRIVRLSQHQMARFAKVSPSTVGRVEAGSLVPSLAVLERLLGAAGLYLVVVDQEGRVVQPMADREDVHDGAGRRYPTHLDTILDPQPGEWWGDIYGLARPPETYRRSSADREARRRRSQWEVRVAQHRNAPPPPIVHDYY